MPIFNSNVYTGKEARDMLMRGVDIVADAVKTTLGAKGSNAVLQQSLQPFHIVTNDGISIAQEISSRHPVENIGVNIVKEVATRANKESGDGTTTAVTLVQAILREGMAQDVRGVELMRSLDECLPVIGYEIDKQKREITVDDVASVASVSAEDPKLGLILQEIYQKIGKDGIIELDTSGTPETCFSLTDGIRLRNCSYLSPYMANSYGQSAVYKNPKILIVKQRIATLTDIDPIFAQLSTNGFNEVVMFVDDIDPSVTSALAYTHTKGIFKTLIIKAPVLWKDWLFEDFAKITGATVIEANSGVTLKTVGLSHLGTCSKLVTTKEDTIVTGIKDISEHIKNLEADSNPDTKLRIAWLNTKAATLRIGANSESELSYKRLKAEDARNASWLALQDGIVPGGGVALRNAADVLPDTIGGRVLKKALWAPIQQIMRNAGLPQNQIDTAAFATESEGFDAKTGVFIDMWDQGIVDPVRVVKNSIRTAISVAARILSVETVTVIPKETYL